MDYKIVFGMVGAASAIFVMAKVVMEYFSGSKTRLKDDYRFAKEFLNDLSSEKMHPLAVQRGYLALAGAGFIKTTDIACVIALDKPQRRLRQYIMGRRYVKLNGATETFRFRTRYRKAFARRWRKVGWLAVYILCALAAFGPLIFIGYIENRAEILPSLVVSIPTFVALAVHALINWGRVMAAELLVKDQRKHTPLIPMKEVGWASGKSA